MSADAPATSGRFRQDLGLPFPLVGDPSGAILRAYEVRWPLIGLARRVTYVIGPDCRVRLAYRDQLDPEAHARQALAALGGDA